MKLLELTVEERAWLSTPQQGGEGLAAHLGRVLADTLRARLRCPVRLDPVAAPAPAVAPAVPLWRIDDTLAAVWLARRLGGRFAGGQTPFVPAGLRVALDTVLAERWLDRIDTVPTPAALAWRLAVDEAPAALGLELPRDARAITGWARAIIAGQGA